MPEADRPSERELLGGRYRLGRELGAGGMGVVHEAVDETLGATVALKLIHRGELDATPEAVARLSREARAAARLGHPNIVRVLDLGHAGGRTYLVMELLGGETLADRLERERRLELDVAVRIHLQLLDALRVAHAAGVIHRDVKPENVFVTRLADGSELVKLLDFGLAYLLEEASSPRLTATGFTIGTPAYMAPERIRGSAIDLRADLYSVGVSLYECLTGSLPFDADTSLALRGRILLEEAPSLSRERPEVPEKLAAVVAKALAKEPGRRFADATTMATALSAAIATAEAEAPGTSADERRAMSEATTLAPEDVAQIATSETLAAISPRSVAAAPEAQTRNVRRPGHADEEPGPSAAAPPLPGQLGAATLVKGGVTVPSPRPSSTADGIRIEPPVRARRSSSRAWLLGIGGGAIVGASVLALLLWIASAAPEPRVETAPTAGSVAAEPPVEVEDAGTAAPEPQAGAELPAALEPPTNEEPERSPEPPPAHRRAPEAVTRPAVTRPAPADVLRAPSPPPGLPAPDGLLEPSW